jgi:hypothetical protein
MPQSISVPSRLTGDIQTARVRAWATRCGHAVSAMRLSLPLALHGLASSPCQTRAMSRRRAPASRPGLQRRWGGAWETCLPWCPACGRRSIGGVRFAHERPSRCHHGRRWRDRLLWCQAQRCQVERAALWRAPSHALCHVAAVQPRWARRETYLPASWRRVARS